jgi:hypothetical protein
MTRPLLSFLASLLGAAALLVLFAPLIYCCVIVAPLGLLLWALVFEGQSPPKSKFVEHESHADPPYEEIMREYRGNEEAHA